MEKKFEFEPYDKVLVRDLDSQVWMARTFECMIGEMYHVTEGFDFSQCIPYNEETKYLHRTSASYIEPKWMPKEGEEYFRPCFAMEEDIIEPTNDVWANNKYEFRFLRNGWVFQTEAECKTFCDKLTEAMKNVK